MLLVIYGTLTSGKLFCSKTRNINESKMRVRISTIVGVAIVIYVAAFLLNGNLSSSDIAEAQHVKRYQFDSTGVAAIPFGKLEGSQASFVLSTNELSRDENSTLMMAVKNGWVSIDHGETVTIHRFVSETWQGKFNNDGSTWSVSGVIKDPFGNLNALEFNGNKVQTTNKGDLYVVTGMMKNGESEYSLHHLGTIDVKG